MYLDLLSFHSFVRWILLISLLVALARFYRGYLADRDFSSADGRWRHFIQMMVLFQLSLGLILYFTAPSSTLFYTGLPETLHIGELRFFGLEHPITMLLAVASITVGSHLSRHKQSDHATWKSLSVWYTKGLALMSLAIPWGLFNTVGRPLLRLP